MASVPDLLQRRHRREDAANEIGPTFGRFHKFRVVELSTAPSMITTIAS